MEAQLQNPVCKFKGARDLKSRDNFSSMFTETHNVQRGSVKQQQYVPDPQQRYIPGLHSAPPDMAPVRAVADRTSKEVPRALIRGFLDGSKNPISALMEYVAIKKLPLTFSEVAVSGRNKFANFAYECMINNYVYPQGAGKTKKEAKTVAAKIALQGELGYDNSKSTAEVRFLQNNCQNVYAAADMYAGSADVRPPPSFVAFGSMDLACSESSGYSSASTNYVSQPAAANSGSSSPQPSATKHPVSELNEYCMQNNLTLDITISNNSGPMGFKAMVAVNQKNVSEACAPNKKEAKRLAALYALGKLNNKPQLTHAAAVVIPRGIGDDFSDLSLKKYAELTSCYPEFQSMKKNLCTFIIKWGENEGKVVSLATGNSSLSRKNLTVDGRSLIDSDAIVMARRAFQKYLYKELKKFSEVGQVASIFEPSSQPGLLKMRDDVFVHLYMSDPPTGDYKIYLDSPSALKKEDRELVEMGAHHPVFIDENCGVLCVKNEYGNTYQIQENRFERQTLEDINNSGRFMTMSGSDKLLKWNVLGVQGTLLTNYIEPVYLQSITLGKRFDHGHLSRTVCCRMYDILGQCLPKFYKCNHPHLNHLLIPSVDVFAEEAKTTDISINWSLEDDTIEITNGKTGRTTDRSPYKSGPTMASRLCKAAFFHRFKDIAKLTNQQQLYSIITYEEAKQRTEQYAVAKDAMYNHCMAANIGGWVSKPTDVNAFIK